MMGFFPEGYLVNGSTSRGEIDEESGLFWKMVSEGNKDLFINEVNFLQEAKFRGWEFVPQFFLFGSVVSDEKKYVLATKLIYALNTSYLLRKEYSFLSCEKMFVKVAEGLRVMHNGGYVHRDVKPLNILFNPEEDKVSIVDFGAVVKFPFVGDEGQGTPAYISPEQVLGEEIDQRTDIYSFGASVYHLVVGQHPFIPEDDELPSFLKIQEIMNMRLDDLPPEPRAVCGDVSQKLNDIVMRCMQIRPEDRYQNMEEVIGDLLEVT